MAVVESGGVAISYEVLNRDGPGVPVFFIAGLVGVRGSCMKQAAAFSAERPVVLHDHRGTGQSAKPLGVYSIENMAADVIAIMDDAGIDKAHMVGVSTGGAIIQVLCIDHADRVQSAALGCSWPKYDNFFIRQFEMRKQVLLELGTAAAMRLASFVLYDPEYFTANFDEIAKIETALIEGAPPPEVDAERIDAILAHDQLDRLGLIRTPVKVFGALNDAVCPPYFSRQLAAAIRGAELKLYDGGGHFFFIARADEFNSDIRQFISSHE